MENHTKYDKLAELENRNLEQYSKEKKKSLEEEEEEEQEAEKMKRKINCIEQN